MARDVHGLVVLVQHARAAAAERVHRVVHGELVPRHGLGRHDDRVALPDLHLAVVAVGHARERRHRLALRAGAEHGDLVVPQLVEVGRLDQRALLDVGVAQVARDVEVLDHRAADDGDLAAAGLGGVDDALQAVDVRREARHDHAAGRVADDALERGCDELLGLRDARALGVRGVGEHQVDAVGAEPRELGEIGRPAVDRRVVDLVVARVQDRALGGVQRDRDGIGHRVRDARELGRERAAGDGIALAVDLDELGVAQQPVLVQLRLHHAEREPRAPDLAHADLAHHVRQRADVILVAVREDDRVDAARRVAQVGEVGQDEVDAGHLVAREREAAVDQDAALALLDDAQVVADLAQAPERDDAYDVAHAAAVRPLASRAERSTAHCSSVASTSGSRGAPARSPMSSSAALSGMGLVVMESAS